MKIQSNTLLAGSNKYIQVVNGCVIAKEGPNMISKMGLDLNIDYDSVMTTRQTLKNSGKITPIMYGFLGTDITFLIVRPIYEGVNPMGCSGSSSYMEYYYEDDFSTKRTFTDILVLSGDADHRIPQIYLYNPNSYTVTVDIFAANLDDNTISTNLVPQFTELNGLSFNSVRSDQLIGFACTGSSQFEIVDINGNNQMVIPYNRIDIISIDNNILTVTTKSDDPIKLTFLSVTQAEQALSRMNWLMEKDITRYATAIYPCLDKTPPVITFNTSDVIVMDYVNGVITKAMIIWRFIDKVEDYDDDGNLRDGIINNSNLNLLIMNKATGEQVEQITVDGEYIVTFTIKDIANNSSSEKRSLIVDSIAPTIYYTDGINTNIMDLYLSTTTPGIIEPQDIRGYYISNVWDNVDGKIPNSAVTITIQSGTTLTSITDIGYYNIKFDVNDRANLHTTSSTQLYVTESSYPTINYNSVFTGSAFTMSLSSYTGNIYDADIRTYALSSVTDFHDVNIDISNVIVSGATFPINGVDNFTIGFSVSDRAGNTTSEQKWLVITT